ncbi:YbjN domain-containing protein [Phenylobacterium kunshanense]|uniref:YbjN domain-containing protein n=1 Tax=Phenylobacterium kunshanense TaxID=1445034 RepID=A0A328BB68_9CAUL|nr:YbjN domain-containing protein [Phenylobacterium kunshanense]RAK64287.1 hypothetical protein DJ019_14005 [Phenylobacterium kunshanense]
MRRLILIPAALACLAAAPAPKTPPAKAPVFDVQNPQTLTGLIAELGAKTTMGRREEDSVFVTATSAAANFSLQFAGCDANGRACRAALFDSVIDGGAPTLGQVNGFNQTSVFCRIYQDKAGKPHAIYAAMLVKSDTRDSAMTHLAAWQGCLGEAREFVRDPVAYLANAA